MANAIGLHLLTSPSLSILEDRLLSEIETRKRLDPFQSVTVLNASNLLGRYLARQLVRRGTPHLGTYFLSFPDLARTLSRRSFAERGMIALPAHAKAVLVRKLARELGRCSYFSAVREHPHFPVIVEAALTDLEDSLLDLEGVQSVQWQADSSRRKVTEFASLFSSYRAILGERFYAEADLLLEGGERAASFASLFGTDELEVYGFYELTGAQKQMLAALAQHVKLTVYLFTDKEDRFRFSHLLRDWFRALGAREESLKREEIDSDLATIPRCVFTADRQPRPADGSLCLLSCPNEVIEAREIAREAVRLRREDGLDFREMAVIVRDAEHYIPLISASFEKLGIPYYVREGLPLARTPLGRSLLALLRLPKCNYRRFDVMDWLTQGAVSPNALTSDGSPAPLPLWDRMSMEAGVVEGLQQWRDRLQALEEALRRRAESRRKEDRAGLDYLRKEAEELRSLLEGVFARLDRLSRQATWRDIAEQAVDLLCDYHQPSPQRDEVQDAIDSLRSLDTLGEPADSLLFLNLLEKVLVSTSEKRGELSKTGIHLLSLTAARHTRFRAVFLPGLTERRFPLQGRQDPILLDFERVQLSSLSTSAHLPLKRGRPVEERLLFLIALEAAGERLILSFPRSDAVSGAHRIPSYYALKAIACLTDRSITFEDISRRSAPDPRVRHISDARILSVEPQASMDEREFDLGTVRRCLASAHPGTARYLEYLAPAFCRSVQAEQAQWGSRTLSPYDGLLSSPTCQERLAEILGATRIFSPTSLERYAACPYHFFLTEVLGLEVLEEPEAIESLEPKELGILVHQILRDFYEKMKNDRKLPLDRAHFSHYRTVLEEICLRQFGETEAKGITGYPLMWELTRKFIRQDLERHLLAEMDRDLDWVPKDFERSFGFGNGSPCVEYPLNRDVLHLRGKIDRIDLSPDGKSLRVMDYKTGKRHTPGTVGLAGGTMLQLPLYLQASAGFYPEARLEASSAEYCYVGRAGSWKPSIFEGGSLHEKRKAIRNILTTILSGCRRGLFPRYPENHSYPRCSDCDFKLIGDPRHDTLWERKHSDPCLAEFLRMRETK